MSQKVQIGLIVPLKTEAEHFFQTCFERNDFQKIDNVIFYHGKINGIESKIALSGVGLVNPAIATSTMIKNFDPEILVMTGSAGGINAKIPGDVIIGNLVYNYDFGTFDQKTGHPFYPNPDELFNHNINEQEPLLLGTDFYNDKKINNNVEKTIDYFKKNSLLPLNDQSKNPIVKYGTIANSTAFYTPQTDIENFKKNNVDVIAFEDISFLYTCWFRKKIAITMRGVSNVLPVIDNPPELAKFGGKTSSIVATKFLKFYFNNKC